MAPYGLGTWASRSLVYAGGAVILACRDIKDKMITIAAHLMKRTPTNSSTPTEQSPFAIIRSKQISMQEIARVAYHQSTLLPEDMDPGLEATRRYRAPDPGSFSNSLHAAVVEVDIKTGAVAIQRYIVIEDCGTMVNPLIVDGQIIGGVAQGIGQALLEHAAYDEDGQPIAVTLADYLVPLLFGHAAHRNSSPRNPVAFEFGRVQGHGRRRRGEPTGCARQRHYRRSQSLRHRCQSDADHT